MSDAAAAKTQSSEQLSQETSDAAIIQQAIAAMEAEEPKAGADAPQEAAGDEQPPKEASAEEEKPPEGPAATGWARVAKKEKKLVEEKRALKAEREKFESEMAQFREQMASVRQAQEELTKDPLGVLGKLGITFEDLAKRVLADGKASPEESQRRELSERDKALKEIAERQERIERAIQQREIETAVREYKSQIGTTLQDSKFELLRAYPDAEAEVFEFAEKYAAKHKVALTPSEAAEKLQEQFRQELSRLASHEAIRSYFTGQGGQNQRAVSGPSQVPQRKPGESPKTLTNNLAGASPRSEIDTSSMSEDELISYALRFVGSE